MSTTPAPFLVGEKVYLRALVEADAEGPYATWFNDEEVCQGNSHHVFPYTQEAARDYIEYAAGTRDALVLAIVTIKDHQHIGNIALQKIHPIYQSAYAGVFRLKAKYQHY